MPADYEASRRRDERFAKRFLFTLLVLALAVHLLAAGLYLAAGRPTLIAACGTVDIVLGLVAFAVWLSGKIIK
jgi:hypothetical protein